MRGEFQSSYACRSARSDEFAAVLKLVRLDLGVQWEPLAAAYAS